jgi:EmrB/QacA subfamily drug resistance transporter
MEATSISSARRSWVLVAMSGALAMTFVDETGVGVVLDTIQRDLGASATAAHWVMNAYLLALAALVGLGGRLSDLFGHRRVFLVGLGAFSVASALSGAAPGEGALIAARALQGAGAALLIPTTVPILTDVFPPLERPRAIGLYIGGGSVFYLVGPLLAGVLTDAVGWRLVFWINLPLALAVATLTLRAVPPDPRVDRAAARAAPAPRPRVDLAGAATLALGLGALVGALMAAPDWGWGAPGTIAMLALAPVALVAFVLVESRQRAPLFDVALLRAPVFAAAVAVVFLVYVAYMGLVVFGPLLLQRDAGMSAAQAGLALVLAFGPIAVTAPLAGRLVTRIGPRIPAVAGAGLGVACFAWLAVAAGEGTFAAIAPALPLFGLSIPITYSTAVAIAQNAAPEDARGEASGWVVTAAQAGAAVGVALLGALLLGISPGSGYATAGFRAVFVACAAAAAVILVLALPLTRPGAGEDLANAR